jgi:hypothetical protein
MPAQILDLIDKQDNVEIVRDQIAAILTVELANQKTLSGGVPQPQVFVERSNPWGQFIEPASVMPSLINVWFDNESFDESTSNVVERQKCVATINVDCYGAAASVDDGDPAGGHQPADLQAALEAQRTVRLARNILMAGAYTYLGLRGLVWKRFPQTISMFQPQIDNHAVQRVVGARLALQVQFNEFSPQVTGEPLETLMIEVLRKETGQLLLRAEYPTPPNP